VDIDNDIHDIMFNQLCVNHACANGHQHIIEWLLYKYPEIDIRENGDYAVRLMCYAQHYETLKWLFYKTPNAVSYDVIGAMFCMACAVNDLPNSKWAFRVHPDISSEQVEDAFINACQNDHTLIMRWLLTIKPDLAGHPLGLIASI